MSILGVSVIGDSIIGDSIIGVSITSVTIFSSVAVLSASRFKVNGATLKDEEIRSDGV